MPLGKNIGEDCRPPQTRFGWTGVYCAGNGSGGEGLTLSSIASLVIPREPPQVHVLNPRHPRFVLLVVDLPAVLGPRLLLLLLLGERAAVGALGGHLGRGVLGGLLDLVGHACEGVG